MSYEDTLKIRHTAEFEIVENELWIYHGFDLGDIDKDVTGFFMNRDEAVQLRDFLNKWLSPSVSLGVELGLASMAIFEAQKAAKAAEKPCQHEVYASHSTLQWLGSSLDLKAGTQLYRCTTCDGRFDLEMGRASCV